MLRIKHTLQEWVVLMGATRTLGLGAVRESRMKREISLDYLDYRLHKATKILDSCARLIRDLDFNRHQNIRRIGEALASAFYIQKEIYELRPDLMPDFLKKPPDSAKADEIRRQVYELRPDLRPEHMKKEPPSGTEAPGERT